MGEVVNFPIWRTRRREPPSHDATAIIVILPVVKRERDVIELGFDTIDAFIEAWRNSGLL